MTHKAQSMNRYSLRHRRHSILRPLTQTTRLSLIVSVMVGLAACQGSPINGAASSTQSLSSTASAHNASVHAPSSNSSLVLHSSTSAHDSSQSAAVSSVSSSGAAAVDADGNGLIEISTLADLNEVRNNLDGDALFGSHLGCPAGGCFGFELTTDLNFDANGDGEVNEDDPYWNEGAGWMPIGTFTDERHNFTAVFDGNGHSIHHLTLLGAKDQSFFQGLFGSMDGATVRNLGLPNVRVNDGVYSAALAGEIRNSTVVGCFVTGVITEGTLQGAIAGSLENSVIEASYVHLRSASIQSEQPVGVVGSLHESEIRASYAILDVAASSTQIFSIGFSEEGSTIQDSYAISRKVSGNNNEGVPQDFHRFNEKLQTFRCPIAPDNTLCASVPLFEHWGEYLDQHGKPYWHFGSSNELPVLNYQIAQRDSDADGIADNQDAFPLFAEAMFDGDADGAPGDKEWSILCDDACQLESTLVPDQFPSQQAIIVDADGDGLADAWAATCDPACQQNSLLTLDPFLDDYDNDGLSKALDSDDNNDNIEDADSDSNGLIEVASWQELDAIRYSLSGHGQRWSLDGALDSSGCPTRFIDGKVTEQCWGYELTADLDFDTNQDGQISALDDYWNEGKGWLPLANFHSFEGVFNGNGRLIRNLMINSQGGAGLFGLLKQGEIRNLGFTGDLMSITGSRPAVLLHDGSGIVSGVFAVGGRHEGLISRYSGEQITLSASFVSGVIDGVSRLGSRYGIEALAVHAYPNTDSPLGSNIINYPSHSFEAQRYGVVPQAIQPAEVHYWGVENNQQEHPNRFQVSRAQLACQTRSQNTNTCVMPPFTAAWPTVVSDNAYWHFGNETQLPGLVMAGQLYRDSDGDGVLDREDAFPNIHGASIDSDLDGAPDHLHVGCEGPCAQDIVIDVFPSIAEASTDTDLDGLPDVWNSACDADCQQLIGLSLDPFPNDFDNDGIPDALDDDDDNNGIVDVDSDSNGLIEIYTLEQLNAVRFNLAGQGRQLAEHDFPDSSGCPPRIIEGVPTQLCQGYELMNDINFDSNADGQITSEDQYWHGGLGWQPLGSKRLNQPFTAIFEGNGFALLNLFVNLDGTANGAQVDTAGGFLGFIQNAELRNLTIAGPLTTVSGGNNTGGLVAYTDNSVIKRCYINGTVQYSGNKSNTNYPSYNIVAGLAGRIENSVVEASASNAGVSAGIAAGLVGKAFNSIIKASYSTGPLTAQVELDSLFGYAAGLVGFSENSAIVNSYTSPAFVVARKYFGITHSNQAISSFTVPISSHVIDSYWVADARFAEDEYSKGKKLTLRALQCPTSVGDANCPMPHIFESWQHEQDEWGQPYWNLGNSTTLPILNYQRAYSLDSDGDQVANLLDAFPLDPAASIDTDADGAPDTWTPRWLETCTGDCLAGTSLVLDEFPLNSAVAADVDQDGLPDAWAPGCDAHCRQASNIVLDDFIDDSDNDGIPNVEDADKNGDGIEDADIDGDGLIEITSFDELNAMRFNLLGTGQQMSGDAPIDSSGCPFIFFDGAIRARCHGYELQQDMDFDQNNDGVIDALDVYVDGQHLWQPIGSDALAPFGATFEGNGYRLFNLTIDSPLQDAQGFWGYTRGAVIRHIGLESANILGQQNVGGLIGSALSSSITDSYVHGHIQGTSSVGGIAGRGVGLMVKRTYVSGQVRAGKPNNSRGDYAGGILGTGAIDAQRINASVSHSYVSARISTANPNKHSSPIGGAFEPARNYTVYTRINNSFGISAVELACPTSADNESCTTSETLFLDWTAYHNTEKMGYWDFGSDSERPRLRPSHYGLK